MRTEHRRKLVLCAILLVAAASPAGAECVGFSLKHYKRHADLVFSGTIREIQQLDSIRTVVTFDVDRVWKGDVGRQIRLHQVVESIDSFRFVGATVGSKYLVFATRLDSRQRQAFKLSENQDTFGVPICGGGTHKLGANDTMLRQLGPGREPAAR